MLLDYNNYFSWGRITFHNRGVDGFERIMVAVVVIIWTVMVIVVAVWFRSERMVIYVVYVVDAYALMAGK